MLVFYAPSSCLFLVVWGATPLKIYALTYYVGRSGHFTSTKLFCGAPECLQMTLQLPGMFRNTHRCVRSDFIRGHPSPEPGLHLDYRSLLCFKNSTRLLGIQWPNKRETVQGRSLNNLILFCGSIFFFGVCGRAAGVLANWDLIRKCRRGSWIGI